MVFIEVSQRGTRKFIYEEQASIKHFARDTGSVFKGQYFFICQQRKLYDAVQNTLKRSFRVFLEILWTFEIIPKRWRVQIRQKHVLVT